MRLPLSKATIAAPSDHTVMDEAGAVRSVQAANVTLPEAELEAIWSATHLEQLARTYWRYLSRVTLGLIRVRYTATERAVVLLGRPLVLLRFAAPEYEMGGGRGLVRWRILDGVLVARPGEGFLEIEVVRRPSQEPGTAVLHVEVEVANFYPAISVFVARWFYRATQARIHVIVTHGFLRSLAKLELEESAVGRFAVPPGEPGPAPQAPAPVTVGDTPWGVIGALAVGAAAAALLAVRARR
jgi:hypothetical protein